MLVLSRKLGETIVVPQCDLSLTVIGVHGHTIRLGIDAPPEVGVYRNEVCSDASAAATGKSYTGSPAHRLDDLVAELADNAYQFALSHGYAHSWLEVELDLWHSIDATVKHWGQHGSRLPAQERLPALSQS